MRMSDLTVAGQEGGAGVRARSLHWMAVAAWLSILLGVAVEGAVLLTRAALGMRANGVQAAAEFASSVTWSLIVCTGISLGSAAARHRTRMMGLMGLLCAPLAWALAKGIQHGTLSMLDAPPEKLGVAVVQIGLIKTLEYTLLAVAVGALLKRPRATWFQYCLVGLGIGVVFGPTIVGVNLWHAPGHTLPSARLLGLSVNEIVFPIGCVTVLHFINRLNSLATQIEATQAPGISPAR
jgi:hypothetical protein